MRFRPVLAALVVAATVGLASARVLAAQPAAMVSINIIDEPRPLDKWGYAPGSPRVAAGTWVTWSNNGYDAHSVTAVDGSFDSGPLNPSEGYSMYFDQDGTYEYLCSLHTWMSARVVVGSGVGPEVPAEEPAPAEPAETEPVLE
jgi:plastocyanin